MWSQVSAISLAKHKLVSSLSRRHGGRSSPCTEADPLSQVVLTSTLFTIAVGSILCLASL
jgi:hypothetical protein